MNDYGVMNRPSQISCSFQRKNTDRKTESLKNMSTQTPACKYIATFFNNCQNLEASEMSFSRQINK